MTEHHFILHQLNTEFSKCSDCGLTEKYRELLEELRCINLSPELISWLCEKSRSGKHIWEIRFEHLRVLLLNFSSRQYDLRKFYLENLKKCRRPALKLFFIRGYAMYANEKEIAPLIEKFAKSLETNHDYIDYNYFLSEAGLPYLAKYYGYDCFVKAFEKAKQEHEKIDPLLRGYFTLDSELRQIDLLSIEEVQKRSAEFLKKIHEASKGNTVN